MKKSVKFSLLRVITISIILMVNFAFSYLFYFFNNLYLDDLAILIVLNIVFFLIFIINLFYNRTLGSLYVGTNYLYLLFCIIISYVFLMISTLFLDYLFPFSIITIILCSVLDFGLVISFCIYLCMICSLFLNLDTIVIFSIIVLIIITGLLCDNYKKSNFKHPVIFTLILLMSSFLSLGCFNYVLDYYLSIENIMFCGINALIISVFFLVFYKRLCKFVKDERRISYETILDENYPILTDIRKISTLEYNHAIRVANISGECADLIGVDKLLCMAGGLYYNASNISPKGDSESFFNHLENICFPPDLINLLIERDTIKYPPSSKESAIVNISDIIVTKIEAIYKKADKSNWNTSMIVYQTLNDCSKSGVYDNSGLGMNEFLKIRDFLAQVEYSI